MEPEMLIVEENETNTLIIVSMCVKSDRIWARVDKCC